MNRQDFLRNVGNLKTGFVLSCDDRELRTYMKNTTKQFNPEHCLAVWRGFNLVKIK